MVSVVIVVAVASVVVVIFFCYLQQPPLDETVGVLWHDLTHEVDNLFLGRLHRDDHLSREGGEGR